LITVAAIVNDIAATVSSREPQKSFAPRATASYGRDR
jgi:hypothetical protein